MMLYILVFFGGVIVGGSLMAIIANSNLDD